MDVVGEAYADTTGTTEGLCILFRSFVLQLPPLFGAVAVALSEIAFTCDEKDVVVSILELLLNPF